MENTKKPSSSRSRWIQTGAAVFAIVVVAAGSIYWVLTQTQVEIDSSTIQAPVISLSPTTPGKLQAVFVNEGDIVAANTPVAQVGNELVTAKVAGLVVSVPNTIGAQIPAGQSVVQMIDTGALRVIGKIDEDKGLSRIAVGDQVTFTVDAFGGEKFSGTVDEVSPISQQTGVVFNISDQRAVQQFDVKVRFDSSAYPQLKNGMSARMWVYTQ